MKLTRHATVRMQQRGIDPLIVDWVLRYGACVHDHHGGIKRYFDKKARRRLARDVGPSVVDKLGPLLDAVVIQSAHDQRVVTAAHRTRRIRR